MTEHQYSIGIDLGTTNCAMAALNLLDGDNVQQQGIRQLTSLGTVAAEMNFPSFLYLPTDEEKKNQLVGLDWDRDRSYCCGIFAKKRGQELSERLVSSAKSWLCHDGIDRRKALLPLDAEEENKLSPLDVSARYLQHLKESWNHCYPEAPFEKQSIQITVPASFDPSAKQMVEEAAALAGFPKHLVLLEEPLAAFYHWLERQGERWREALAVGDTVLVVDIGGGTTDFTLIRVNEESGNLSLERVAVGDHLLLGGDNIDLAIAYLAKEQLEADGHTLDDWQMRSLTHACREAKEALFSETGAKESVTVSIMGRGSSLIGGSLNTVLTRAAVETLIVDGFFPLISLSERSKPGQKKRGMQTVGLPYVEDPRMTAQLARFLFSADEQYLAPTTVLFNGGTVKPAAIRERVLKVLNHFAEEMQAPAVRELADGDLDFSVSRGAAHYGLVRKGKAIRIRGGISRSYFIGIEEALPAVPGREPPIRALCIAQKGMEEGTEAVLDGETFHLFVGDHAAFRFFSLASDTLCDGTKATVGTAVPNWSQVLDELHPIETFLKSEDPTPRMIEVTLRSHITELGMLELWCHAENGEKWKLEFDVREKAEAVS